MRGDFALSRGGWAGAGEEEIDAAGVFVHGGEADFDGLAQAEGGAPAGGGGEVVRGEEIAFLAEGVVGEHALLRESASSTMRPLGFSETIVPLNGPISPLASKEAK